MILYVCYVVSLSCCSSFHVLIPVAALCSKLCNMKDKNVTSFSVLREKGGNEIMV
jgi:hypothetical protein